MKNFTTALIIACSFSALTISSCRKEKADVIPSAAEYLSGKWRVTHFAYDNNYNGTLDSNEKYEPEAQLNYVFYYDGTGTISSYSSSYPDNIYDASFNWFLQNNSEDVVMTVNVRQYTDKYTAKIKELDANKLILEIMDDSCS